MLDSSITEHKPVIEIPRQPKNFTPLKSESFTQSHGYEIPTITDGSEYQKPTATVSPEDEKLAAQWMEQLMSAKTPAIQKELPQEKIKLQIETNAVTPTGFFTILKEFFRKILNNIR